MKNADIACFEGISRRSSTENGTQNYNPMARRKEGIRRECHQSRLCCKISHRTLSILPLESPMDDHQARCRLLRKCYRVKTYHPMLLYGTISLLSSPTQMATLQFWHPLRQEQHHESQLLPLPLHLEGHNRPPILRTRCRQMFPDHPLNLDRLRVVRLSILHHHMLSKATTKPLRHLMSTAGSHRNQRILHLHQLRAPIKHPYHPQTAPPAHQ